MLLKWNNQILNFYWTIDHIVQDTFKNEANYLAPKCNSISSIKYRKPMKFQFTILIITLLAFSNSYSQNTKYQALSIHDVRVEYFENPEGIDAPRPRFSWILKG